MGRRYTNACDIFACGVILFVMATAYPPFETAAADDRWYKYIATRRPGRFWEKHADCEVQGDDFKDLMQRCITYQPRERITVKDALEHAWTNGEEMPMDEVKRTMENLHQQTTSSRREDANRNERLVPSEVCRDFTMEEFTVPIRPDVWVFPFRGYTLHEDVDVREVLNVVLWLFDRMIDGKTPHNEETLTIDGEFDFEKNDSTGAMRSGGKFNVHVEIIRKSEEGPNILILTPSGEAGTGKDWFLQTIFQEVVTYLDQPYQDQQQWEDDWEEDFDFECVDAFPEEEADQ